jgi:hypothetical protein
MTYEVRLDGFHLVRYLPAPGMLAGTKGDDYDSIALLLNREDQR